MSFSIPDFHQARIMVVGDVMLDQYWSGGAERISPEAPVPVVNVQNRHELPGGAGNVALNLRALACEVSLYGLIGDDASGVRLTELLQAQQVSTHFHAIASLQTITKLRVLGHNQQLVRLDFEQNFQHVDMQGIIQDVQAQLQNVDVLVISDYNKGIQAIIPQLIELAKAHGLPVLVDPKNRDMRLYQGATLLTPNLKEFEAVVGVCPTEQDLIDKGVQLRAELGLQALLVTRGAQGMTLFTQGEPISFRAQAQEVYDVTGAGDTVISVLAACVGCQVPLADAVMMANMAAGISVSKLGAATVSIPELRRALQRHHDSGFGMVTSAQLLQAVADARAHGETVVMTNGCFDILTAGHVQYLEQAKAMGARLVVAVNDDDSITRLKGAGRPVVPLEQRMMVLSALRSVDWVVPFSDDTPERLIAQVLPDVLVKGADYQPDQIAGAKHVLAAGGKVDTIALLENVSTTRIIQRIQETEGAL